MVNRSGSPATGSTVNSTRFGGFGVAGVPDAVLGDAGLEDSGASLASWVSLRRMAVIEWPGRPRSCSSWIFCSPLRPTMSPSWIAPSLASMTSAVASPATPRMPRAKVAVGASGRVSTKAAAPGICSIAGGTVPSRSVMASTNACGPESATNCA